MFAEAHSACAMLDADILSVIAPKMDENSLRMLFYHSNLRPLLRVILTSQNYWYERSQYLIGHVLAWRPKVVWKDVYYIIVHLRSHDRLSYIDPINNLDSLLAVQEACGDQFALRLAEDNESGSDEPDGDVWEYSNSNLWHYLSGASDLDVFDYILQRLEGHRDFDLWDALEHQLDKSHTVIVDKLLTLVSDDDLDEDDLQGVLLTAIRARRRDIFDRLERRIGDEMDMTVLFEAAVESDNLGMYKYLLVAYEIGELEDLLETTVASDALAILKDYLSENNIGAASLGEHELEEDDLQHCVSMAVGYSAMVVLAHLTTLVSPDWYEAVKQSLRHYVNNDTGVRYALDRIAANVDLSDLLLHSLDNYRAFQTLLADPRSHPEAILDRLLSAVSDPGNYIVVKDIIQDSRIKTEEMEPAVVQMAHNVLMDQRTLSSLRYCRALEACPMAMRGVTARDLSEQTAYALIARQILFKQPKTDVGLMDWMISLDNPTLTASAESLLIETGDHNTEVLAIRALLLAMLYPSLSQRDLIDHLKRGEYGQEALKRSATLLILRAWYLSNPDSNTRVL